ncbi:MAG TPA: type II toxin-antitoxin system HicA family toxin [Bacillota bacterium]|nr:type II toxin-antitoxin system HicA family toxin [Bacillota bacterium]
MSGAEVIRRLRRAGFALASQRGSHAKLRRRNQGDVLTVIVPLHSDLAPGTLASILRQAKISRAEFDALGQ